MEHASRTLTMNPAGDWLAAAGTFMGRVRLAVRAFGEALHKEPVRSRTNARRQITPLPPVPGPSPWQEPGELPETYGRTKVVAMVVSPYLVHVYWDLSAKDQAQSGPACLRFHDATAGCSFDVSVDLTVRNWYVHLWSPEKRYSVELGLRQADSFQPLARSNPIETPRAWPVAEVAQVTDPPRPAPSVEASELEPPLIAAASAPSTPSDPVPARVPQQQTPPVRANALETLRKRLSELYGFYPGPRPLPTAPESAATEESVPLPPETSGASTRADFTDRLEAQFSPGLSSAQLQNHKPPG